MGEPLVIDLKRRSTPDRLRWLSKKLDEDGTNEITRFAIATALLAVACELEQSDGTERG